MGFEVILDPLDRLDRRALRRLFRVPWELLDRVDLRDPKDPRERIRWCPDRWDLLDPRDLGDTRVIRERMEPMDKPQPLELLDRRGEQELLDSLELLEPRVRLDAMERMGALIRQSLRM